MFVHAFDRVAGTEDIVTKVLAARDAEGWELVSAIPLVTATVGREFWLFWKKQPVEVTVEPVKRVKK